MKNKLVLGQRELNHRVNCIHTIKNLLNLKNTTTIHIFVDMPLLLVCNYDNAINIRTLHVI